MVRGKWLLENILGAPPPPPPPNMPALGERRERQADIGARAARGASQEPDLLVAATRGWTRWASRSRTSMRRASGGPSAKAAPASTPQARCPTARASTGPQSSATALLAHRDEFVGTLTEKLLTYALGRGVEYYDMPAVRTILKSADAKENRWSALVARHRQQHAVPDVGRPAAGRRQSRLEGST